MSDPLLKFWRVTRIALRREASGCREAWSGPAGPDNLYRINLSKQLFGTGFGRTGKKFLFSQTFIFSHGHEKNNRPLEFAWGPPLTRWTSWNLPRVPLRICEIVKIENRNYSIDIHPLVSNYAGEFHPFLVTFFKFSKEKRHTQRLFKETS